jgi:hypothetical protein
LSLELLDAHRIDGGLAITFATDHGLESLAGSFEQVARLAQVMQQVSALASVSDSDGVWLEEVVVGDAVVKLGLNRGGQARIRIDRAVTPSSS